MNGLIILYISFKNVSKQLVLGKIQITNWKKILFEYTLRYFSNKIFIKFLHGVFSKTLRIDMFYLFGHESCNNWIKDACRVTKWNYARKCRSKIPSSLSRVGESINGNGGVSNKLSDIHSKVAKYKNYPYRWKMISIVCLFNIFEEKFPFYEYNN